MGYDSTGLAFADTGHSRYPELILGKRLKSFHFKLQLLRGNALLVGVLVVSSISGAHVDIVLCDDAMGLRRRDPRDE